MPFSTDVIVRKDEVTFPESCVVCGKSVEGEHVRLRGNPVGFYGFFKWIFGATKKLNAPAHLRCGSELSRSLLIRNLSGIILATAVVIVAVAIGLTKWQAIGLVIAVMAIPIFWQMIRPLPFEFTFRSGEFNLMFRDSGYAHEVAVLNDGEIDDDDGKSEIKSGNS